MRPATEEMLTMSATPRSPSAASSRWGTAALVMYISPSRLTSTICCHSSTGASSIGPRSITPALLTRTSRRPSSSTVRATADSAASRSLTSSSTGSAVPPVSAISAPSASSLSVRRAAIATVAPRTASIRAAASPIPLEAPVTRATAPFRSLAATPGLYPEIVRGDQVAGEGADEGVGHRAHVGVFKRPQLDRQFLRAKVELFVESVDRDLVVDRFAGPLALGAAAPDAPAAASFLLLPGGRLHQRRAAVGADVQRLRSGLVGSRSWHGPNIHQQRVPLIRNPPHRLPQNPAAPIENTGCADPAAGRHRYHGRDARKHRTSRDRDRPHHRPAGLRAETPAGAGAQPRPRHPRVQRLDQRRARPRGRRQAEDRSLRAGEGPRRPGRGGGRPQQAELRRREDASSRQGGLARRPPHPGRAPRRAAHAADRLRRRPRR